MLWAILFRKVTAEVEVVWVVAEQPESELEPVIDFFLGNTAFFRSVAPQDTIFRVRSVVNP